MIKIKEMIEALQLSRKPYEPNKLTTVWGKNINKSNPLPEYPRPQMVRDNYTMLNGLYKYAFTNSAKTPTKWEGDIVVPFSPETQLSGVERQLMPDEFLWYKREFEISKIPENNHLLLHFGACDERCRVYVNDLKVGVHSGGYQAFSFDITSYIKEGTNTLSLCVKDVSDTSYHGKGKQSLKASGMFYTAQSGLWQSVWCEWVPQTYVKDVKLVPCYDQDKIRVELDIAGHDAKNPIPCKIDIYDGDTIVSQWHGEYSKPLELDVPDKKSWSPVSPFLYDIVIRCGEDRVKSYFGMRCFTVENDNDGIPRLCLNHVPYFQNGILDQGYYPESLMTPPTDEAMIHDIQTAKALGFNMIRKHCKIEPMRWYYHCDRLGMLVWQDMINGGEAYNFWITSYIPTVVKGLRKISDSVYGYTSRLNAKGRAEWKRECQETVRQLINCPCICTWVLFNEGWGQFDAQKNTAMVRRIDDTRFIDSHSGWFDQGAGDMSSEHIYFFDLSVYKKGKPYVISEYGGIAYHVDGESYSDETFGYGTYENAKSYKKAYEKMMGKIESLKRQGLCAAVYTQLTDIEEEVNGVMTYTRKKKI